MADNESAFDLLYCITFKLMDHQWLTMRASYMDFNVCTAQLLSLPSEIDEHGLIKILSILLCASTNNQVQYYSWLIWMRKLLGGL